MYRVPLTKYGETKENTAKTHLNDSQSLIIIKKMTLLARKGPIGKIENRSSAEDMIIVSDQLITFSPKTLMKLFKWNFLNAKQFAMDNDLV